MSRDDVERIKSSIDVVSLIGDSVNLTAIGNGLYTGAISSSSKSGSSLHVDQTQQLWHDFAGGAGGDCFNWIAIANNLDIKTEFARVLEIAAKYAGIEIDFKNKNMIDIVKNRDMETLLTAIAGYYHLQLTEEHRTLIKKQWGISNEMIDRLKIGFAPRGNQIQDEFKDVFPEDLITGTGLMLKFEKKDGSVRIKDLFNGRIVFPYWKNGQVVYFIGRQTEWTPQNKYESAKYIKQLVHNEKHDYVDPSISNQYFYGEDSIRNADYVLITEGVTDCIMAMQNDIPCISPVTTNIKKSELEAAYQLVKHTKKIVICNDNEDNDSGKKGALTTAEFLVSKSIDVRLVELPRPEGESKIDLAEYLRDHEKEDFIQLIDDAKSLYQVKLESVLVDTDPVRAVQDALKFCKDELSNVDNVTKNTFIDTSVKNHFNLTAAQVKDIISETKKGTRTKKIDTKIKKTTENISVYFDEKGRFIPKSLGDEILTEYDVITFQDTKEILVYKDGIYDVVNGEDTLRLCALKKLGNDFKTERLSETIEYIKLNTLIPRSLINPDNGLINVKNGMYCIRDNKLIPHDKKYLSTTQLNVVYDAEAQCPEIDKYLHQVTNEKDILAVAQYAGYSCTTDIKQQKSLLIEGPRANGKSTFIELVCSMVGHDNVSEQSIQALNTDRFARAQLNGKLLNFFSDLPKKKLYDNSVFKMLTTDRWIDGEEKYIRKFRFKNTIHQIYSANQIPDVDDPNEMAYFRRWIIVSFPNIFEKETDNKNLLEKITTEQEIAGFFNICMVGLRALLKHNEFCNQPTVEETRINYLVKSNPIHAFLDECVEYSEYDYVKQELYNSFKEWCKKKKISNVIKDNVFGRKLKQMGYEDGRKSDGDRVTVWKNIGFSANAVNPVKDSIGTLTDSDALTDTENTTIRQGSKDNLSIVEKYTKLFNDAYDSIRNTRHLEKEFFENNPDAMTDDKIHEQETSHHPSRLNQNPDGTLTNPDEPSIEINNNEPIISQETRTRIAVSIRTEWYNGSTPALNKLDFTIKLFSDEYSRRCSDLGANISYEDSEFFVREMFKQWGWV